MFPSVSLAKIMIVWTPSEKIYVSLKYRLPESRIRVILTKLSISANNVSTDEVASMMVAFISS